MSTLSTSSRDVAFMPVAGIMVVRQTAAAAAYLLIRTTLFLSSAGSVSGRGRSRSSIPAADIDWLADTRRATGLSWYAAALVAWRRSLPANRERARGVRAVNAAGTSDVKIISYSGIDQLTHWGRYCNNRRSLSVTRPDYAGAKHFQCSGSRWLRESRGLCDRWGAGGGYFGVWLG